MHFARSAEDPKLVQNSGLMISALVMLGGAAAARGQWEHARWEVVFLHRDGARDSVVRGVSPTLQAGVITAMDWNYHPVVWHGSGGYVDLLPPWAYGGAVFGVDGNRLVGYVSSSTATHAMLWESGGATFVDLSPNPAIYVAPHVRAISGGQQVGYAYVQSIGRQHAVLWRGSAESLVDLNPPGAQWSQAFATDGVRQGGWANRYPNGGLDAILWEGSAESFVDMDPADGAESRIEGMANGVQVGWTRYGSDDHALLWRGTPESVIDLNPPGARDSQLLCTDGSIHGGYATATGLAEAGIWASDEASSFINLHEKLGAGWYASGVSAVGRFEGRIFAGGSAAPALGQGRAVVWIGRQLETELPRKQPQPFAAP